MFGLLFSKTSSFTKAAAVQEISLLHLLISSLKGLTETIRVSTGMVRATIATPGR